MGLKYGVTPLEHLKYFKARDWYHEGFVKCAARIASDYVGRNEVLRGGVVTEGSGVDNNAAIMADTTALTCVLNGRVMATIDAKTNKDLSATGVSDIANPIFSDGSDAATGIDLAAAETAYVTLLVCNSDGSGGTVVGDDDAAAADGDEGQAKFLVIFAGTGTGAYDDDHLSSLEIQAALDATEGESVDHSGCQWAHVAQIVWADESSVVSFATTMNRNNVTSEA